MTAGLPDNNLGAGRVNALAAVQTTMPAAPGEKNRTFDANTPFGAAITAAQLGFTDPNDCTLRVLNWTGGCGTGPDTAVTCPVGVSNIAIEASNNGFMYSPSVDMQITVTNFGVGASPAAATVAAGQTATYAVTVSRAGRRLQQRRDALVRQPAPADLLRVLAGRRHAPRGHRDVRPDGHDDLGRVGVLGRRASPRASRRRDVRADGVGGRDLPGEPRVRLADHQHAEPRAARSTSPTAAPTP